jgi:hypothetical protein
VPWPCRRFDPIALNLNRNFLTGPIDTRIMFYICSKTLSGWNDGRGQADRRTARSKKSFKINRLIKISRESAGFFVDFLST